VSVTPAIALSDTDAKARCPCDRMTRTKPRYNTANATDSLPQVSVSNFEKNDERVTCSSCHFRYSTVREFCPMCGTQAPEGKDSLDNGAGKPASGRTLKFNRESWVTLRERSHVDLKKTIAILSIALLVGAGAYFTLRSRPIVNSPAPVPSVEAPESHPDNSKAIAPSNATEAPTIQNDSFRSSKPQPAADISTVTKDTDPKAAEAKEYDTVELWNQVRHGDAEAEVALAQLYLSGAAVERNCEQAHMLLLAASRKQNESADKVLDGAYKQSCP
jgi:hypothetical protein